MKYLIKQRIGFIGIMLWAVVAQLIQCLHILAILFKFSRQIHASVQHAQDFNRFLLNAEEN